MNDALPLSPQTSTTVSLSDIPGCTLTTNAQLRERTTFRVPAQAATLIEVSRAESLPALFDALRNRNAEMLILGSGSNILFTRDWPGTIVSIATRGIEIIEDRGDTALVRCAAGEVWNDFVHWSLAQGFVGLENLALIPGLVGAAPIQNIGAYGVEVHEFVDAVDVYDRHARISVRLDNAACAFAYRDSLFKREPGRFVIISVDFLLPRQRALRMDYAGIPEELAAMGISVPDARALAAAIVRVRTRKLPDPAITGNAGSFFKNPFVTREHADALRREYPHLQLWPTPEGHAKLSAAWLIEICKFKGFREGDAGVSNGHALVLVNYGHATGAQIWALAQRIQREVATRFGVHLEPEPLVI